VENGADVNQGEVLFHDPFVLRRSRSSPCDFRWSFFFLTSIIGGSYFFLFTFSLTLGSDPCVSMMIHSSASTSEWGQFARDKLSLRMVACLSFQWTEIFSFLFRILPFILLFSTAKRKSPHSFCITLTLNSCSET
jgi:hypothetical protein